MERTAWGRRFVQFLRWKPSTYRQVWLSAVLGTGVWGFIVTSVVFSAGGQRSWLANALLFAVGALCIDGLLSSRDLKRRRREGNLPTVPVVPVVSVEEARRWSSPD